MRQVLQILSFAALAGTLAPSMIYCAGGVSLDFVKWIMLLSTIVWFAVTPFWMGRKTEQAD